MLPFATPISADLACRIRSARLLLLDFDGVFTANTVYVFEDGREAVRCSRFEGFGLSRLREAGVDVRVLSTEVNPVVTARCKKLNLPVQQACTDKAAALAALCTETKLKPEQIAYLGNDVNDTPCLQTVGLPMVVRDAHPDVLPLGAYCTQNCGGDGAVREVCDLFVHVLSQETSES